MNEGIIRARGKHMLEFLFNYPVILTVSALIFGLGALVSLSLQNFMPLFGAFIISMVLAFTSESDLLKPNSHVSQAEFDKTFIHHDSERIGPDSGYKRSGNRIIASHVDYSQRSIFTCYEDENKCIRDLIIKIPSEVSSFSEYDAWLNRPKSERNDWWWLMLLLVVLLFLPK